jgi:hypothetical protein
MIEGAPAIFKAYILTLTLDPRRPRDWRGFERRVNTYPLRKTLAGPAATFQARLAGRFPEVSEWEGQRKKAVVSTVFLRRDFQN